MLNFQYIKVEFTLRHSHSNDHIFIYDIQLRCIECSECDASGDVELLEIGDDAVWEARTFTDGDGIFILFSRQSCL